MSHIEGIQGLQGRDPIGAAISIGIKSPRGFPTDKDKFFIVSPREVDGVRPQLPQFAPFHQQSADKRRILRGVLTHATRDQCFEHRLSMRAFPKGYPAPRSHPNMRPVCEGDGKQAVRWMQDKAGEDFQPIRCPHDQCEFRQLTPPLCKPFMRVLFGLRWPDGNPLPTPLVKYTSGAWSTTANWIGFFDVLDEAIRWCVEEQNIWPAPTYYGLPFTMSLIESTNRQKKTRFPTVIVSPDVTPASFFMAQRSQLLELKSSEPAPAITDERLQADDVVDEDIKTITVG